MSRNTTKVNFLLIDSTLKNADFYENLKPNLSFFFHKIHAHDDG